MMMIDLNLLVEKIFYAGKEPRFYKVYHCRMITDMPLEN